MAAKKQFRNAVASEQTHGAPDGGVQRGHLDDENPENAISGRENEEQGTIGQFVRDNPVALAMTGFGVGLGFGLMVTLLLTRRSPSWIERNLPEAMQHFPERIKRVPDSLASYVPASWKY